MPNEPLVTIMIPTYNGSRWLGETLACATAQTHRNLRILVSDDGSTDGTPDLVAQAAVADPRIRLIQTPGRARWVGNTNHLLDHVDGEYACFLMHDDLIVDDYVETLLAAVRKQSSPALAYGDMQGFAGDGLETPKRSVLMHRAPGRLGRCLAVLLEMHWSVALRGLAPVHALKSAPRPRVHGGDEYGADGPWIAALAMQVRFIRVPEVLYFKRDTDTGVTSGWRRTIHTASELTRSYGEILRESPGRWWERAAIESALAARLAIVRLGAAKEHLPVPGSGPTHMIPGGPILHRQR